MNGSHHRILASNHAGAVLFRDLPDSDAKLWDVGRLKSNGWVTEIRIRVGSLRLWFSEFLLGNEDMVRRTTWPWLPGDLRQWGVCSGFISIVFFTTSTWRR